MWRGVEVMGLERQREEEGDRGRMRGTFDEGGSGKKKGKRESKR